jgi:5-methylcytosine-specific restriction enzyme subunit McrC
LTIRRETIVESAPRDLDLTLAEARALTAAGKRLALSRIIASEESDSVETDDEPTLIRCQMNPSGTWRVTVTDAVGLIAVGDLRLLVEPKIPRVHLFHLFGRSDLFPRIDATKAAARTGAHLWELVCRWLIDALEHVLRRDLVRDYLAFRDTLETARGRIDPLETGSTYYRGSLHFVCDFEEFGNDTPLNRVLKAAALAVAASPDATPATRRRALAAAARMDEVSPLRTLDLRVTLDRRTAHYADALALARSILSNIRRGLEHGNALAWTFLIRTPELVEAGVRNELRDRLGGKWNIRKETIPLHGAGMTVSPDLLIGFDNAIGDVKYKRAKPRWLRPDLYEVTTFAAAAEVSRAAIIGFRGAKDPQPPAVGIGDTEVRYFGWVADEDVTPDAAANALAADIEAWLETS